MSNHDEPNERACQIPGPSHQRARELLALPRPAPFVIDPNIESIWGDEMERDLADSERRRLAFVAEFSKPLPNWPLRLWVAGWALALVVTVLAVSR